MTSRKHHSADTIEIRSRTELLNDVRSFISSAARAFGFPEDEIGNIALAVDEACTNIIKHAYKYDPDRTITVQVSSMKAGAAGRKFIIRILDNGKSFDPATYTPPDMPEYFKQLRRGGLGIILMRKLMDEVQYDTRPGRRNALRLVKYLRARDQISA